jgi:hypothetical protein
MPRKTTERPTGWVGYLYDICSNYADDPIGEICRIANQGLSDGILDTQLYKVLQHRTPFPRFEHKTFKVMGKEFDLTRERIRQLEIKASSRLMSKYLDEYRDLLYKIWDEEAKKRLASQSENENSRKLNPF